MVVRGLDHKSMCFPPLFLKKRFKGNARCCKLFFIEQIFATIKRSVFSLEGKGSLSVDWRKTNEQKEVYNQSTHVATKVNSDLPNHIHLTNKL